jgi:hypothetical protein
VIRRALALPLVLALAACAAGPGGGGRGFGRGGGPGLRPIAEPGEIVAVELAFARAAQDEGQWTAFSEYAADQAVMFTPQPVLAKPWLKGRANPPKAISWQPYQVWSSCDGSFAVSKGGWQQPDTPLKEPELVQADVADCPARGAFRGRPEGKPRKRGEIPVASVSGTLDDRSGQSIDGTLAWSSHYQDGSRTLSVSLNKGGAMKEVVHSQVSP